MRRPLSGLCGRLFRNILILAVIACAGIAGRIVGAETVVFQLPSEHGIRFAGLYIAEEKGFFSEAGLAVELRAGGPTLRPLEEVSEGRARFGIGTMEVLLARLRGRPLQVVTPIFQLSPHALCVTESGGIRYPFALKGQRVTVGNSDEMVGLWVWLLSAGVTRENSTWLPDTPGLELLEQGRTDAVACLRFSVPLVSEKLGRLRIIDQNRFGGHYGDALFISEETGRRSPDVVVAMHAAVLKGWSYAMEHPQEAVEAVERRLLAAPKTNPEQLLHAFDILGEVVGASVVELGHQTPARWKATAAQLVKFGFADNDRNLTGFVFKAPAKSDLWVYVKVAGLAAGFLAVVLVIALVWNWRLRRLVERRTAEANKMEAKYRLLFDSSPNPLWVCDRTTLQILAVNKSAVRVYGYSLEEFLRMSEVELWLPDDRKGFGDLTRVKGVTLTRQGLWRHMLRSGAVIDVEMACSEIDFDGRPAFLVLVRDVTEQRRMQLALQQHEDKIQELLLGTDCLIWQAEVEEKGGELRWSMHAPATGLYIRLFGEIDPLNHVGVWDHRFVPEMAEMNARSRHAILAGANGYEQEFRFNRDGRVAWLHEKVSIRVDGPSRWALSGVVTDITRIKIAETALREEEERYRHLFESNPNPMWLYDWHTLAITDVNRAATTHYGYSADEFRALTLRNLHLPEDVAALESFCGSGGAGMDQSGVWRHRRKDGSVFFAEVTASTVMLSGTKQVVMVCQDVTRREEALSGLRASERRYRELFDGAIEGVYQASGTGDFLRVNPAFAKMLGYAHPGAVAGVIRHGDLYLAKGRLEELFRLIGSETDVCGFESEVRCQDGTSKWISENVRAVRDAQQRIQYLEGFVTETTERRRLEAEMARASKLESVGVLAGGIAHDFNNILTAILGNITLATYDTEAGGSVQTLLKEAERAATRARDLTQQMLTFAKGGEPVRSAVHLADIVEEVALFTIRGSRAKCEFSLPADLWSVNADRGQLGQVVQNLVINAVQAMPRGGVIRIEANNVMMEKDAGYSVTPGEYVRVSVKDDGMGIRPEHMARVFDPYFSTKEQGSGLGLATVYSIIRKHQGMIEVESETGRGTTFHFWLPAICSSKPVPAIQAATLQQMKGHILFMDDEEGIRGIARAMLSRFGLTVDFAVDGGQAVAMYAKALESGKQYDAVVMDLTVPGGMGGREATQQILKIDSGARVIVSSGYSSDPIMADYRAYGFLARIPKPYSLAEFSRVLKDVLNGSGK